MAGYLIYRYVVTGMSARRAVRTTLRRYDINKTPSQIIREYYHMKGQLLSDREVHEMERRYMHEEPDQFLAMYDEMRARLKRGGSDDGDDDGGGGGGGGGGNNIHDSARNDDNGNYGKKY